MWKITLPKLFHRRIRCPSIWRAIIREAELEAFKVVGLTRREYYRDLIAQTISSLLERFLAVDVCDSLDSYTGTIRIDHAEDQNHAEYLCRLEYRLVVRNELGGGLLVRIEPDDLNRASNVFSLAIDNADRLVVRTATYRQSDRPRAEGQYSYFEYGEGIGFQSLSVLPPGVQYSNYDEGSGDFISLSIDEGELGVDRGITRRPKRLIALKSMAMSLRNILIFMAWTL
ncbi:MAG: hypothetical protein MZU97_22875 [Bacillus subtilis]|nr:hypothetical protein [Bacillus subtilis]